MSSELEKEYVRIMSEAFYELNEIIGYEYFQPKQIRKMAKNFVELLPLVEELVLKPRGVTIKDLEKEEHNYKKGKRAALLGILDGYVLKEYEGNTFKEKFKNYIYDPGIECKWLQTTEYCKYLQTLLDFLSKVSSNTVVQFVFNYKSKKLVPISQGIVRVFRRKMFFRNVLAIDEKTIDETLEIFRELGAIAEHHLKLLYAIKYNYSSEQDIFKLENTEFYRTWKDLKEDEVLSMFTKPFPNTLYWNASKHGGISKKIRTKEIEFKSNEGIKRLSYSEFILLVRELYACVLPLTKINLIIRFHKL